MTTQKFQLGVGAFSNSLTYQNSGMDLNFEIPHGRTILFEIGNGRRYEVSMSVVMAHTPHTYHSGNRPYGKYIFLTPDNIRVVMRENEAGSNSDAAKSNKCLIKGTTRNCQSIGFDFYIIEQAELANGVKIETAKKLEGIEYAGFGYMPEEILHPNLLPANLRDLTCISGISGSGHIYTQGWTKIETRYELCFLKTINGVEYCNIPFAIEGDADLVKHILENINEYDGCYAEAVKTVNGEEDDRRSSRR